jgi:hypothetical protein
MFGVSLLFVLVLVLILGLENKSPFYDCALNNP